MGVTIVANEFSKETEKKLQEEADRLSNEYHYSPFKIMDYFVERKLLAVSLNSANGQIILSCRSIF